VPSAGPGDGNPCVLENVLALGQGQFGVLLHHLGRQVLDVAADFMQASAGDQPPPPVSGHRRLGSQPALARVLPFAVSAGTASVLASFLAGSPAAPGAGGLAGVIGQQGDLAASERLDGEDSVDQLVVIDRQADVAGRIEDDFGRAAAAPWPGGMTVPTIVPPPEGASMRSRTARV
jgi:hypothetical protein